MVDSLDNVMENAYEYGRTGIETYVDEFLKDADKEQRRKLKEQILVIWDRIIQYWMDKKTSHGPNVSPVAITDSIGEIVYNEGMFVCHSITKLNSFSFFACDFFLVFLFAHTIIFVSFLLELCMFYSIHSSHCI